MSSLPYQLNKIVWGNFAGSELDIKTNTILETLKHTFRSIEHRKSSRDTVLFMVREAFLGLEKEGFHSIQVH